MKKPQWIMVGITTMFVCVLLGIFLGRRNAPERISPNTGTTPVANGSVQNEQNIENNDGKININTASKNQLMLLDGIGETTAQKIIDYRTQNGNFTKIEDIMNVKGIGEKKFEQIKDRIKIE